MSARQIASMQAVSPSLDEADQEWVDTLTGHRAFQWSAGDQAATRMREAPTRVARDKMVNHLASIGHFHSAYVRQLARVAAAFGPEFRKPDLAWAWYRAVLSAASRTRRPMTAIFAEATAAGWHAAELNALGRDETTVRLLKLNADCDACGATVRIRIAAVGTVRAGMQVACPVCAVSDSSTLIGALVAA